MDARHRRQMDSQVPGGFPNNLVCRLGYRGHDPAAVQHRGCGAGRWDRHRPERSQPAILKVDECDA